MHIDINHSVVLFNLAGSEADQVNGAESVFDIEQRLVITVVGEPPVWKLIIFPLFTYILSARIQYYPAEK